MRPFLVIAAGLVGFLSLPGADWLTDGGSPRRDAWQKNEKILSVDNVKNTKLLWKLHLDNEPKAMYALLPTLIVENVTTSTGVRQIAIQAGSSDNIYAIDVEKGSVLWHKHFASSFTMPANPGHDSGVLCPHGLTATPVVAPAGTPGKYTLYAASWDGMLHQLNVADGEDVAPPAKWMPPNGKPFSLNLWNGVLFTHTAQGCGGHPNSVYTYDLSTNKAGSWGPSGGGMWGRTGPAISSEGVMYTGTGDGQWRPQDGVFGNGIIGIKINPDTKAPELADYYAPSNAEWLVKRDLDIEVTPTIFNYKGHELMAGAGKECRLYLMDTAGIGGDDHRTPLYRSPLICNEDVNFASAGIWGALANWVDPKGVQWLLTPIWGPKRSDFKIPLEYGPVKSGAIVAFKVEESGGKWSLNPVWMSRDMNRAEPPVIANGVVWAYGNGEDTDQAFPDVGLANDVEHRIPGSTHAVLYALDAQTGKSLWDSGNEIASWNHFTGLSVANGRVYIGTFDNTLYCYGIKK